MSLRYNVRTNTKHLKLKITTVLTLGIGGLALAIIAPAAAFGSNTLYVGHTAVGNGSSCASPGYNSVQTAVNNANNGDTVYLCGSQFAEQVFVNKSITLTGDTGSGLTAVGTTFTTSPANYPSKFTSEGLFVPQALLVTTGDNVTVNGLKISGPLPGNGGCANEEYGVLALDGNVNLKNDLVANIEDANSSLNGCQFGVGVEIGRTYWQTAADFSVYATPNPDFSATASIDGVTVTGYAKNGITIDGTNSSATVENSIVVGGGNGQLAAQNGIQISRGATGAVQDSTIADNAYNGSGEATAVGVLIYGGYGDPLSTNVVVDNNKLIGNDEAINFANYSADGSGAATSPTKDVANDNWIFSPSVTNTSGLYSDNDGWIGYQAGIEDVGDKDSACGNTIIGPGYTDEGSYDASTLVATPGPDNAVVRDIDAGYTFPTTDFTTCNSGYNYGGGHFSSIFLKDYQKKFINWYSR